MNATELAANRFRMTQTRDKLYFGGMIDEVRAKPARLAQAARTVKKIPKQVLSRCEWGHDDYSLQVENLPKAAPEPGQQDLDLA